MTILQTGNFNEISKEMDQQIRNILRKINFPIENKTLVNTDYSAIDEDVIEVNSNGKAVTITLPNINNYQDRVFTVKDTGGNAATLNITLQTLTGSNIEGGGFTSTISSNFGFLKFYGRSTIWHSI